MLKKIAAVLALVVVAACEPVPTASPITTTNPQLGTSPVSPTRAVQLFDAICGANLPSFRGVDAALAANGFTDRASSGSVFSPRENASFRVLDGPGSGQTCSFVFASSQGPDATLRTLGQLSPRGVAATQLGITGFYRGTEALVLYRPPDGRPGGLYNLRLLSER